MNDEDMFRNSVRYVGSEKKYWILEHSYEHPERVVGGPKA